MSNLIKYFAITFMLSLFACKTNQFMQGIKEAHNIKIDSMQVNNFVLRIQQRYSNYESESIYYNSIDSLTGLEIFKGTGGPDRMPNGIFMLQIPKSDSVNIRLYSIDERDSCAIYSGVLSEGWHNISFASISTLPKGKYILKYNNVKDEIFYHK